MYIYTHISNPVVNEQIYGQQHNLIGKTTIAGQFSIAILNFWRAYVVYSPRLKWNPRRAIPMFTKNLGCCSQQKRGSGLKTSKNKYPPN